MQIDPSIFTELIQHYGIMGIMFAVLLTLYIRQNKRMAEIEDKNDAQADKQLESYKELIHDYIDLVQKNTGVIEKLTGCINSIKDAIDRIDRKHD